MYTQAFKQKVKHLLYEHGRHIEQLKSDAETASTAASDDFHAQEALLLADKRALQTQLREQVFFSPLCLHFSLLVEKE